MSPFVHGKAQVIAPAVLVFGRELDLRGIFLKVTRIQR
jgi:hypothetical protein